MLADLLLHRGVYGTIIGVTFLYLIFWTTRRFWRTLKRDRSLKDDIERKRANTELTGQPDEDPDIYLNGTLLQRGGDYSISPNNGALMFEMPLQRHDVVLIRVGEPTQTTGPSQYVFTASEVIPRDMRPGQPLHITREPWMTRPRVHPEERSPEDGWVRLQLPDLQLRAGDLVMHEGTDFLAREVHQDFNPGGHYTYVKLEPVRHDEMGIPRTRYQRMLDDDWED